MSRKKNCTSVLVICTICMICMTAPWSAIKKACAQDFELRIEAPATAPLDSEFDATLLGRSLVPLIGYSARIGYDSALTLNSVSVEGTVWESADVIVVDEQPAQGTVSIGVVLDTDSQGVTQVGAPDGTAFARFGFSATRATAATIAFRGDRDFNLLIDANLEAHDAETGLLLTGARVEIREGGGEDPVFLRGDCNVDGDADITDAIFFLNHLFLGGPAPTCDDACDANDTGVTDISDAVWLLNFLFVGGGPPPPPFPVPGVDPTADALGCGPVP